MPDLSLQVARDSKAVGKRHPLNRRGRSRVVRFSCVRDGVVIPSRELRSYTSELACLSERSCILAQIPHWHLALDAFAVAAAGEGVAFPALVSGHRAPETG